MKEKGTKNSIVREDGKENGQIDKDEVEKEPEKKNL